MPAYISEIDAVGGTGNEFVEIAVTTGTDLSGYSIYVYASDGTVSEGPLSLGTVQNTVAGKDVYVVNSALGLTDLTWTEAVALVDEMGNAVQFISFNGNTVSATEGPAGGSASTDIGTHGFSESLQSDDGGLSYSAQTPNGGTVPCYAPGTLIDTPDGPRAVETLAAGDLVTTLDHGPMPIRWVRRGDKPLEQAAAEARPILIRPGAFGPDCPNRDLVISPQHRILVGGCGQIDGLFDGQCFAPAKALTGLPRIRTMMGRKSITWVHFACDSHEVVTANGCYSESLLLGPMVLNRLTRLQRGALIEIFGAAPAPDAALNGPAARDCLPVGQVRRVIEKLGRAGVAAALAA